MTEAEWLACTDPQPMLEFLRGKASDRKLRLFAVACCRRIWHLLTDDRSRQALQVAERFADGLATDEERNYFRHLPSSSSADAATRASVARFAESTEAAADLAHAEGGSPDCIPQCHLLRCLFGTLAFRPVILDPAWRTATGTMLAQAIYDDRAFDRMPILADALEDAGCTNQDILAHCRSSGKHVRGCWVVDLLLDKS
jgi:hypothetical protein